VRYSLDNKGDKGEYIVEDLKLPEEIEALIENSIENISEAALFLELLSEEACSIITGPLSPANDLSH
jgi:hypothetical protein